MDYGKIFSQLPMDKLLKKGSGQVVGQENDMTSEEITTLDQAKPLMQEKEQELTLQQKQDKMDKAKSIGSFASSMLSSPESYQEPLNIKPIDTRTEDTMSARRQALMSLLGK